MQARRRAQPSGTNSPSSSHPRLKHRARCVIFCPCPPCGRQGRPGQGFLAGSNTSEPRGSAPRERDHRGGDHPVPSRTRQLSPPSPRVLQRKAAGGQGVALAEGAFLSAPCAPRAPRAPHAPGGARGGIAPRGPLRVLGHCPAGRFDRRRALGRRFFYLYEAPARFAGPGRVPAGGSPPCGSFCIPRPFAAGGSARGLLAGPVLCTACAGGIAWAPCGPSSINLD